MQALLAEIFWEKIISIHSLTLGFLESFFWMMFLQLQNRMISICHSDYTMYARISFYDIILTKILIESDDSNQSKIAPCTFFFLSFFISYVVSTIK